MPIFLKLIDGLNAISMEMPGGFLKIEIDRHILKCTWKCKGLIINKSNFEKEKVGKFIYTTRYKTTALKYWHKNSHIDEWNSMESSNVDPNIWMPR